jgi:hypothetical protein
MTMQGRIKDIGTNITDDLGTFKIFYNSLDAGNSLYIKDTIQNITYDSVNDTTKVDFDAESNGTFFDYTYFLFEEDLTDLYSSGDKVKITLTVKLVTITFGLGNFSINYTIELFEEQWPGEEYFKENIARGYPYKAMDKSLIEKI